MIKVIAKGTFYEDKIEEAKNLYSKLVEESRKEKGCIAYNLYQSNDNRLVLLMIEEWDSNESLEIHKQSKHFTELVPQISKLRKFNELNTYELIY
ncbi:MAG: putative quinol monooxygenase [Tissierellia bacterium]|nr:putative quinol monooxygenase [Tissierellia bacterium]